MTVLQEIKTEHQQQVEKLNAEVLELRRLLRHAQRMASVGTMTAMIAHEFNNILTPIINYAQMARSNPALTGKAITRAADGGRRASEICAAILGMTHNAPVELETVSLRGILEDTLVAMARDLSKDCIQLLIDIPGDLEICTRRVELQQVLMNLLLNARAAVMQTPAQRRIEVHASGQSHVVTIHVTDTGVGIPPGNLEQVFNPHFTTKDAHDDQEQGHGLGLALCREIIESLGGQISAHSKADEGAAFTIQLPRLKAAN